MRTKDRSAPVPASVMEFAELASLGGLAAISFLAATLLPMSSEAVLVSLAVAKTAPLPMLLLVAGVANTAGSCFNWLLGRWIEHYRDRRWFPVSPARLARAQHAYARWGWPSLLLAWVPFIGDPLTVAAGLLRTPFWLFLPVVAIAKFGRYIALVYLFLPSTR